MTITDNTETLLDLDHQRDVLKSLTRVLVLACAENVMMDHEYPHPDAWDVEPWDITDLVDRIDTKAITVEHLAWECQPEPDYLGELRAENAWLRYAESPLAGSLDEPF